MRTLFLSRTTPRRPLVAMSAASSSSSASAFTERVTVTGAPPNQKSSPPPSSSSSLEGLTVCIKDIMDMEGHTTGYGHPLWKETHEPATRNAEVVDRILGSGATITGRTHMDELAWSLFGVNHHYGTPPNPAAPGKIPGGSSSGSASAVASGEVDVGIGTDTGGSVRVPASYCGVFGIRPTWGRVSLDGARALAPSFDTCGWFARDAALLRRVGHHLLLPPASASPPLKRWLVARDAFDLADEAARNLVYGAVSERKDAIVSLLGPPEEIDLDSIGGGTFDDWFECFRVLQSREVWTNLGPWVEKHDPSFGPGIKERFEFARVVEDEDVDRCAALRERIRARVVEILGADGMLMLPTTPGPPPTSEESPEFVTDLRARLLRLTSISGLTGLPQVAMPIDGGAEGPVGLSVMGPPGSDEALLELVEKMTVAS